VDFSRTLIFMTSNLGAAEMNAILRPNLGFAAGAHDRDRAMGIVDTSMTERVTAAGIEAARRKFSPEFMNRIDKTVVFHPLGAQELRKILGIELGMVQLRIFNSTTTAPFVMHLTEEAKDYLLREGTDMKYGARHLKRAVDRALVHPLSNLMATSQVHGGDLIRVDYDPAINGLTFYKDAEDMPAEIMSAMADIAITPQTGTHAAGAVVELTRSAGAKSTKR
jgi:ATP-dependent Clp protease ATP-binding subunit ClpA